MSEDLLKKADIQKIAADGAKIYQGIKIQFEPKETGKFLAIDIETKNSYLANTSADAVVLARAKHPNKVFYVVRVGYDAAETMARAFTADNK